MNSPIRLLKPAVLLGTVVAAGLTFSCSTVSRQDSTRVTRTLRTFDKNGRVESRTINVGQSSIVGRLAANKSSRSAPPSAPVRVRSQPVPVRVEPVPVIVQRDIPAKRSAAPPINVPVIVETRPQKKTIVSPVNPPDMLSTGKVLSAHLVPSQAGFVRSPYTNPPRLVIVKDASPGTTMICPYTHKPFVVPAGFISAPHTKTEAYVSNDSPPTRQISSSALNQSGASPKVIVNNKEFGQVFPSPEARSNSPIKSEFTNSPVNITPPAENKTLQDAPYGNPIPGRPGFVNSPHAARNQLVDVTGLPAGMEVKCPYSGKLFRVPPSDMASGTAPSTTPGQN